MQVYVIEGPNKSGKTSLVKATGLSSVRDRVVLETADGFARELGLANSTSQVVKEGRSTLHSAMMQSSMSSVMLMIEALSDHGGMICFDRFHLSEYVHGPHLNKAFCLAIDERLAKVGAKLIMLTREDESPSWCEAFELSKMRKIRCSVLDFISPNSVLAAPFS